MDSDPGMAFILVQHLAPDHKSLLVELVRRYTRMQVFEVEDGMSVKVNCAYIIPPNRDMAMVQKPETAEYDGMPRNVLATRLSVEPCTPWCFPYSL